MARRFIRRLSQLDNETPESPLSSALFYFGPAGDCNRMLVRGGGSEVGWVGTGEGRDTAFVVVAHRLRSQMQSLGKGRADTADERGLTPWNMLRTYDDKVESDELGISRVGRRLNGTWQRFEFDETHRLLTWAAALPPHRRRLIWSIQLRSEGLAVSYSKIAPAIIVFVVVEIKLARGWNILNVHKGPLILWTTGHVTLWSLLFSCVCN